MSQFSFVLLYVENPLRSASFFSELLQQPVIDQSPGFAMLPLRDGVRLGLWLRSEVEPEAVGEPGGSELALTVADPDEVDSTHRDWAARGIRIAQSPKSMDFGRTFTALDPDGHRIRVFAPTPAG